jgi:hypothetical protein
MPDYGCAALIDRKDIPKHLFGMPDPDLSEDLCAEPLAGPWFRLGACSAGSGRDKQGVENVVYRRSMIRRLNLAGDGAGDEAPLMLIFRNRMANAAV